MAIRKTVIKRYESQAWVDNYPVTAWAYIENIPSTFPPSAHTHNYAGSSSAGGDANNAVKLNGQAASYYLNYNNFTNTPTIPTKASWNYDDRYVRYDTNSQGLNDTQKSNARTNIGAGTSNFTGYTSSNKLSTSYISGLATVATSGSYNDLSNKPTIPTKTSQLTNDSGYLTSSTLTGDVVIDALGYTPGTSNFSGSYNDLSNKPTIPTKVSQLTNDSGYITGITSSMVTTALGYTPYNSSNPNGYTSNTGTVTSVAVKMNGSVKGTITTSGTIDLGTVITSHQDISGKADKASMTAGWYRRVYVNTQGIVTEGDQGDTDTNTWRKVQLNGVDKLGNATNTNPLNIKNGSGITITESSGAFTFALNLTGDLVVDALGYTPGTSNFSGSYNDLSNKPTIPTKVSQLTNDSGYITGITSSMVTTALGYTPYNSSNPNGYTSNTGTVTSVAVKMNGSVKGTITTSGTIDLGTIGGGGVEIGFVGYLYFNDDKNTPVWFEISAAGYGLSEGLYIVAPEDSYPGYKTDNARYWQGCVSRLSATEGSFKLWKTWGDSCGYVQFTYSSITSATITSSDCAADYGKFIIYKVMNVNEP